MADILKIVFIVIGILAIYVNYWLLAEALFPAMVERASRQYANPVKLTLVGLAAAIVPVVVGFILANQANPLTKIVGLTLVIVPGMIGLAGSSGLALRIGIGLNSPLDATQPWRRVLRGGVVLSCSFLLPVIGWVILPLWVLVSGLGAFLLALKEQKAQFPSAPQGELVPAAENVA
ncbi:MAG TPA: hypothetical protein VK731_06230 [Candidatus Cybelea sp.]|nr:hypothetical protein [Candidatus Cybelea sp.]